MLSLLRLASLPPSLCLLLGSGPAAAAVQLFVDDPAGFAAATAGHPLLGMEDWSSAGDAPMQAVAAPIEPGVPNPPFPHGTNSGTGLTVVPNANGANGATVVAADALFYAPAGYVGISGNAQPSNQVSAGYNSEAFHMAFADVGGRAPAAVSFSPMFYRTNGDANAGTITVTVYDGANALVGSASVPNVVDTLETSFLGIVGAPGEIRRVNVWAGGTAVTGADNIRVFAPEPAAPAVAAAAALAALAWRRRPQADPA